MTVGGGRLDSTLKVRYGRDRALNVSGDARVGGLTLLRRDQAEALVSEPMLSARVDDFELRDGAMTVGSVRITGTPTVVDATATPPARFDFSSMALTVGNATWPSRAPARVEIDATEAGSTFALRGTVDPGTLSAEARARFSGVDLRRVAPYVPPDAPVTILRGVFEGSVTLEHDRVTGVRLSGNSAVTDLAVAWRGEPEPFFVEPRLAMTVTDAVVKGATVSVARAVATGTPTIIDGWVDPPRRIDGGAVRLQVDQLVAPGGGPARVQIDASPTGGGALAIRGTVSPATRAFEVAIDAKDVGVAPYAVFIPIEAPIAGRVGGKLAVSGSFADTVRLTARGDLTGEGLTVGAGTAPPLTTGRVSVNGLDLHWPKTLTIALLSVSKPYALIERERNGVFPLRAMLTPRTANAASAGDGKAAEPRSAQVPARKSDERKVPLEIDIGEIVIQDGDARFIDRATTPAFSEEVTGLAVSIRGLRTAEDSRADLVVQAVVGAGGALQLKGQIVPLGTPFYLDVAGELRDLSIAQANPYLRQYAGWIAERGSLTTKLHYRVLGDELTASNDVLVQRIKVDRAPAAEAGDARRVGLPLGMIVAVVTDSSGNIRFNVPVNGKLSAPDFSIGDAIWAAVRNALVNIAEAPLRAIGRLFRSRHDAEAVERFHVDPIRFEPGSATFDAEGEKQLQRVADFLRASPFVKLIIQPAVSAADIATLTTQAVAAAVQRAQRERQLPDFAAAATALFTTAYPNRAVPGSVDEIVAALREREPMPTDEARGLEARRRATTLKALVDEADIESTRLLAPEAPKPLGGPGEARVEFELAR